ncbi:MAG: exodeoxyribonuclease VII small subunit [Actinobacteria bacterium]|nr:MAG: exodeoxyribonuclease VII small subunit [Actinomycetota bacterium]
MSANQEITFDEAMNRLHEIAHLVESKDISLEASLDFLEEGIKLANFCTESIDKTSWKES